MHILLVDDEAELASALAERLQLRGIDADWVTGAEEALARAALKHYDLGLLDMKMPGIDGLELKARLQKLYPRMKFILLTGYGTQKDYENEACQLDETCWLYKPVDIKVLIARMHDLLPDQEGP